ncbi:hypothetical protein KY335_01545 [Candidatus Woesearchaeota archaeon]|nr:hypothetical protein [Candidatus Woesearchaeota archaeon]
MNKKGALRLTVNFIVIIIIATACLVLATTFFLQEKEELDIITGIVEQQAKQQIMRELTQTTSKVVLPIFSAELKRGESYIFGLGLNNYMGFKEVFTVYISFDSAIDTETKAVVDPGVNTEKFFIPELGPYDLEDKEKRIISIPMRAPTGSRRGITYRFNVKVACETDSSLCKPNYGYPHQIEISVI